ncbi:unnamed protein product [Adineta ricciae]|uniref:Uncharacterized protein n=1 Tax=Adineta ricciae TaxID=249248 RepID=A0A814Z9I7_ADIRI|nr:unnamed protein product [Adineta ricciae]
MFIVLLTVSSSPVVADDQYFPRARKIPGGAWLSTHQLQQLGKRGRFVFRDAPNAHHYDSIHTDYVINDDADSSLDKRNWRL